MYLILVRPQSHLNGYTGATYNAIYTDDLLDVAQAFRDGKGDVKAFRIDSLAEIKEVEIEIVEKPKELS